MKNYKLTIQYEGTKYNGWQKQGNTSNTIQEKLETVISSITGESVEIIGSGRTDGGVHAKGQICNFKLTKYFDKEKILEESNKYLPKDIRIILVEEADERFHARLNAKEKEYIYYIDNGKVSDLFKRKYVMRFKEKLDIEKMKTASEYLIGKHDFKSFCQNKKMKKSTIRTIYSINITKEDDIIRISYIGNGFLYNMIRILTGTLIEVGKGKISPEEIVDIIEKKDRGAAGFTAPPEGLFLQRVIY